MEEITLKNRNSDEIAYIPKFKIGVNIYESLTQPYLSLSILEIDSIRLSDGNSGEVSEPFLIKGSNLKILNNDLQIESKSFSLLFSEENSKAIFHQGIINSYPFIHIEALFDLSSESIYYSSKHSFDSKSITDKIFLIWKLSKVMILILDLALKVFLIMELRNLEGLID